MEVTVELLAAGHCTHPGFVVRRGGGLRSVRFPSMVGLLRHPTRGAVLFDAGYSPRFFAETRRFPASLYRRLTPVTCPTEATAVAQLRARGIPPEEVSLVILSHFHADHVGGLADFPNARFLAFRAALDRAFRDRSAWANLRRGILPGLVPADFEARLEAVEERPRWSVAGFPAGLGDAFDLFGDGSVLGFDLSGHVLGQLGLLLPRTQGPPVFLLADACWSRRAFTHLEFPHPITRLLTEDAARYRARIEDLHRLARERPELVLVPSHCAESLAAFPGWMAGA